MSWPSSSSPSPSFSSGARSTQCASAPSSPRRPASAISSAGIDGYPTNRASRSSGRPGGGGLLPVGRQNPSPAPPQGEGGDSIGKSGGSSAPRAAPVTPLPLGEGPGEGF